MKYVNILDETGTLGVRINPQENGRQMVGTENQKQGFKVQ